MTVAIGNDHAGTDYKFEIIKLLEDKGIEVINFGVSGYGTYQNYLMYEIIGKKLNLDIVIVAFAFNDIFDNSLKLQKADGQSKIEISKRPFIDFSNTE